VDGEEPPVLAVVRGQRIEEGALLLEATDPATEADGAEHATRRGNDKCVTRMLGQVFSREVE